MPKIKVGVCKGSPTEKQLKYYKWLYEQLYGEPCDEDELSILTFEEVSCGIDEMAQQVSDDSYGFTNDEE